MRIHQAIRQLYPFNRWRPNKAAILILALLIQWALLFVIHTPSWDAGFYYAFARSIAFDFDLDIENDLLLSYPTAAPDFAAKQFEQERTITGRIPLPFAIGASLLWAPWLLLLRLGATVTHTLVGYPAVITGYEWLFVGGTAVFSMLMGWLAFRLIYHIAAKEISARAALLAVVTFMFATPLLYYQHREPLYSHTASALIMTLCVYVWLRHHETIPPLRQALLLGLLIGLGSLVRWQHIIYAALPIVSVISWQLTQPAASRWQTWRQPLTYLVTVGLTVLVVFSFQLNLWRIFYGTWVTVPQGSSFMQWHAPYVIPTLFSTYKGLFTWMPAALLAIVGLMLLLWRRPRLTLPLLTVLLLSIYVNGSALDWFGGGGFGPRRFTSELAIFIIGYAGLYRWLMERSRYALLLAIPVSLLLGLHQWLLLRYGLIEKLGGRNFSMAPDYRWADMSWTAFAQQLAEYLPAIYQSPANFFILPGSPLSILLRQGEWPMSHIVSLGLTGLFVTALVYIIRGLAFRQNV